MLDGHSSNYSGNGQSYPQKEVDFLFRNRKKVTGVECDGKPRGWRVILPFQAPGKAAGGDRHTHVYLGRQGLSPRAHCPAVWLWLEGS